MRELQRILKMTLKSMKDLVAAQISTFIQFKGVSLEKDLISSLSISDQTCDEGVETTERLKTFPKNI